MTNSLRDLLHVTRDRLRPHTPPAAAARRRRNPHIAAFAAPAVLAALVLWLGVAAAPQRDSAPPPSPDPPGPDLSRGPLTLSSDPFLAEVDGYPVLPGAAPVTLSPCVIRPLTLDAIESGAATYGYSAAPPFANEFVIRFRTVAAAHHAVSDASRQFRHCPTPPNVATDRPHRPEPSAATSRLSEVFYDQIAAFATPHRTYPMSMYSLRVGRWRNIVVVLETKGVDDRADHVLWEAMTQATGRWPGTHAS